MENCWQYQGKCLTEPPEGYYGFIYVITDDKGWQYYGKKAFEHSKKVILSKKARKLSGTRKRIERTKKDSGWLDYWGSSKPFLEYMEKSPNKHLFTREIVKLCKDKASLSYWEMAVLIAAEVLFKDNFWNGNVGGKFFKGKIHV
jgi:hypothetical protein